jgi:hypothetical protein
VDSASGTPAIEAVFEAEIRNSRREIIGSFSVYDNPPGFILSIQAAAGKKALSAPGHAMKFRSIWRPVHGKICGLCAE